MKLLIVDDHAIVREGVAAMLRQAGPDTMVLQAGDGAEGVRLAEAHPDLDAVFLDLQMPGAHGMSAVPELRPAPAGPAGDRAVLVRRPGGRASRARAGRARLRAWLALPQTLPSALRLVLAGDIYVPPLMVDAAARGGPSAPAADAGRHGALTERQREVLQLLSEGLSNKDIGRALNLSDKTVKAHITAIFKALDVVNRTQAASAARRAALL